MAVPWVRRLVAGLSPLRPGLDPSSVHVGFMVDEIAQERVLFFHQILHFLPVTIIPPALRTHLHLYVALSRRTNGRNL